MSQQYQKNQLARKIWHLYFSKKLLEVGLISEEDYRKMKLKIKEKAH